MEKESAVRFAFVIFHSPLLTPKSNPSSTFRLLNEMRIKFPGKSDDEAEWILNSLQVKDWMFAVTHLHLLERIDRLPIVGKHPFLR